MVKQKLPFDLAVGVLMAAVHFGCSSTESEPEGRGWRTVFEDLPGAIISISGTSQSDVWAVGGDPGDGSGAFVLHFDGERWQRMNTGTTGDLWWVHAFAGGPVFLGGAGGTILRYDGGAFQKLTTPSAATVFGIWGTAPNDLWAVGGLPNAPGSAFVWRFDGTTWADAPGLPSVPIASYFKVWGRAADDVRIVAMDGVILHWNGTTFSQPTSPTTRRLLTLHAEPGGRWAAVGGLSSAVVIEDDGAGWADVTPSEPVKAMLGVRLSGEVGYAAGNGGTVLTRREGAWQTEDVGRTVFQDFHSVWIDPKGGVWVAGGDILAQPLVNGIVMHKGAKVPGGSYE